MLDRRLKYFICNVEVSDDFNNSYKQAILGETSELVYVDDNKDIFVFFDGDYSDYGDLTNDGGHDSIENAYGYYYFIDVDEKRLWAITTPTLVHTIANAHITEINGYYESDENQIDEGFKEPTHSFRNYWDYNEDFYSYNIIRGEDISIDYVLRYYPNFIKDIISKIKKHFEKEVWEDR